MTKHKILIVDDEADLRFTLGGFFRSKGYEVLEAGTAKAAVETFHASRPDVAILDYALPDENALALLPRLREIDPTTPIVLLTAHGSIDLAVQAIKEGADHFLTKPVELPSLLVLVRRLLESHRDRRNRLATAGRRRPVDPFLGASRAIDELRQQARRVLSSDSPVLINGETGAGKGVLARWLHDNGARADEPFVDLNCGGLEREFFETEIFGHERGAFTGAVSSKVGMLEVAHRGTVFLDEIGDVDLQVQPKLLKVVEERRFRRLGDVRDRYVDIRLVAATHRDLGQLVKENRFRSDLFFRISTIPLSVPALRERREDIPVLARFLLDELEGEMGGRRLEVTPEAERALVAYSWPGNIRELRNVLERAVLLGDGEALTPRDLRFDTLGGGEREGGPRTLEENERIFIERVLAEEGGRVEAAAQRLGIVRSALYKKIKKHGIAIPGRG